LSSETSGTGRFPGDFFWGASTSAYQIEGATREGGRGESIWDRFATVPGAIADGSTGEVACDHFHLWRSDVALMRELAFNGYRFSVAWPRIFPEGKGRPNPAGLDFYDRLVDELLEAGIEPFVTLYHWDLPQALQDEGGWTNRVTAHHFAAYANEVARRLGDRVSRWITQNEPAVSSFVGYLWGMHAPGVRSVRAGYAAAHHILLAHGLGMAALRSVRSDFQVGIAPDLIPAHPVSDRAEDIDAATYFDGFQNRWFLDPVFKGSYPDDILSSLGDNAPPVEEGDMAVISAPVDFLGVNYYRRNHIRYRKGDPPLIFENVVPRDAELTEMDWEVYPDALRETLERVHREYDPPAIYITENGAAYDDIVRPGGTVPDPRRISYLEGHFDAMSRALAAGVPLKGYFAWSLLDNFEWALGYTKRFGIVYVDYPTQRRLLKDSARWYRDWIAAHR
jgi:beta-glucosidase